jgi:glycosyltransferase involved in cell wall biosynthesis
MSLSNMNIAIVTAVYPPEPVVSAQNGRDLAMHLAGTGASVTVLCPSPSRPIGADYSRIKADRAPRATFEDGVDVVRLPSFTAPQSRLFPRMRESWSFGRHVGRHLRTQPTQPDVIYMNTWPLFSQACVAHFCEARKIPLVMQVMDVYPESLLEKLPQALRWPFRGPLLQLDRWIAGHATSVVLISESMRKHYERTRRLPPGKGVLVYTWIDDALFHPMPDRIQSAVHYGVRHDLLTFLFLGNIGPVAGVELLVETFHKAALPGAQLLIIGHGSSKDGCVRLAQELGAAERVRFISDPAAANVPRLLSLGDVCLLPMRKGAGASSLPSKMMGYMLAGKPILASVDLEGDAASCIREAGCGWIVPPDDAQALADAFLAIQALDRPSLVRMGDAGAAYGASQFSKATGLARMTDVVESVMAPGRNARGDATQCR